MGVVVSSAYPMVFYPVTAPLRQRMRKKDPLLRPTSRSRVDSFFAVCLVVDVLAGCAAATGVDLGTMNATTASFGSLGSRCSCQPLCIGGSSAGQTRKGTSGF